MSIWVVISLFTALAVLLTFVVADTSKNKRRVARWIKTVLKSK